MIDQYTELNRLIMEAQSEHLGIIAYSGGPDVNYAQRDLGEYMMHQGLTVITQLRSAESTRAWISQLRTMLDRKLHTSTGPIEHFIIDLVDYLDSALDQ